MAGLRGRPSGGNRTALADAALVNCVDFERALAKLEKRLQTLLILRYRDGQTQALVAEGMGISVRAVHYLEPLALNKLADALDVEDFL